jgi:signal transduction histidine kinase
MNWNRLINKILNASHTFDENERLFMYKYQTLMAMMIFASSVVFVMIFVRYFSGNIKQAIADSVFILITISGALLLRQKKSYYYPVARVVLFSGLAIATWLIHTVPESQSRVIWFSMIIAVMFFMLNKKEGLLWLGTLILVLSAIFAGSDFLHLKTLDFGIFIANLVMLSLVLLWYEKIKNDNENFLHNYTENLEKEIQQRTQELNLALIEAQAAQKAKDAFFANMSHELRTPLNAIIGFSQILEKQTDLPQRIKLFVEKINISGNNLLKLINTILNFSKIESDNMHLHKSELHVKLFIEELLVLVEPQMHTKRIKLDLSLEDAVLFADVQLLHQAVLNLLSNAVKFTHDSGTITIVTKAQNGRFSIKICDDGVGISQEDQAKLFMPFSQVENIYQPSAAGTGLGLYLTKKIIELHGGEIQLQSREDEGSCFTIFL